MKMLIIGGTGDTGQWFVKFFQSRGSMVIVGGKNNGLILAKNFNVRLLKDLMRPYGRGV